MKIIKLIAMVLTLFAVSAHSAQRTWDGGGTSDNFSDAANWVGDVAPISGDALIFDGSIRTSPYNDMTSVPTFNGIRFPNTASDFSLSGNPLKLSFDITIPTGASANHVIDMDIVLIQSINIENSGGSLEIKGDISHSAFPTRGIIVAGTGVTILSGTSAVKGDCTYLSSTTVKLLGDNIGSTGVLTAKGELIASGSWGGQFVLATYGAMSIGDGISAYETYDAGVYAELGPASELNIKIGLDKVCDRLVADNMQIDDGAILNLIGTIDGDGRTIAISESLISTDSGNVEFSGMSENFEVQTGYYIHYNVPIPNSSGSYQILIDKNPTAPTSSAIDLRAYDTAEGVMVEFTAYDVEADGTIQLQLLGENSAVVWSDSVAVTQGAEFTARFLVPGLELGQSYNFRLRDEVGQWWDASNITVGSFNVESASKMLEGLTFSFDSLAQQEYNIQWCAELGGTWQTLDTVTATAETTTVVVAAPEESLVVVPAPEGTDASGFFRIQAK